MVLNTSAHQWATYTMNADLKRRESNESLSHLKPIEMDCCDNVQIK